MPKEIRDYQPKNPSKLPAPSPLYTELSAAHDWGYTPGAWAREHVIYKAQAVAWHLENSIRESLANEQISGDKPKTSAHNPYEAMKQRWLA